MANWCDNLLIVTGPRDILSLFADHARGQRHYFKEAGLGEPDKSVEDEPDEEFCFHALYPVPQEILDGPYEPIGYDWETSHWGVKFGHNGSIRRTISDLEIEYLFSTPWGPPEPFLDKVAADFPSLRFELKWHEPGLGNLGATIWESGEQKESWGRDQTNEEYAALERAWEGREDKSAVLRTLKQ